MSTKPAFDVVKDLLTRVGCPVVSTLQYPVAVRFCPVHKYFQFELPDFPEVVVQSESLLNGLDDVVDDIEIAVYLRIDEKQPIPAPSNLPTQYHVTLSDSIKNTIEWYWSVGDRSREVNST